jgi:hypothetical protein
MALRRYQDGLGPEEGPADEAQLLRPAAGSAEYWVLSTGQRGRLDLASLDYQKVKARIDEAIDGMAAGRFPRGKPAGGGCWGLCLALAGPDGEANAR